MFNKFISQILALFLHQFVSIIGVFLKFFYLTWFIWWVIFWPWVFISLSETFLICLFLEEWKIVSFIQVFLSVLWSVNMTESHSCILNSKMSFRALNLTSSSKCHLRLTFSHQIMSWIWLILKSLIISCCRFIRIENLRICFFSNKIIKSFLLSLVLLQL